MFGLANANVAPALQPHPFAVHPAPSMAASQLVQVLPPALELNALVPDVYKFKMITKHIS